MASCRQAGLPSLPVKKSRRTLSSMSKAVLEVKVVFAYPPMIVRAPLDGSRSHFKWKVVSITNSRRYSERPT